MSALYNLYIYKNNKLKVNRIAYSCPSEEVSRKEC